MDLTPVGIYSASPFLAVPQSSPSEIVETTTEQVKGPPKEELVCEIDFKIALYYIVNGHSSNVFYTERARSEVKKKIDEYIEIADQIHNYLTNDLMPLLDPKKEVPYYFLELVRKTLDKELGPVLRFLNAIEERDLQRQIILSALFGSSIGLNLKRIILPNPKKIVNLEALKTSVISHINTPFNQLSPQQKNERINYYDQYYIRLEEIEERTESIRKIFMVYAQPIDFQIDWIFREISLSTISFESLIFIVRTEFNELLSLAIDTNMESKLVYVVLKVLLGSTLANLYGIPESPAIFRLRDQNVNTQEDSTAPELACVDFLLSEKQVFKMHLKRFVENAIFQAKGYVLKLNRTGFDLGGLRNHFPIGELKRHFLNEVKHMREPEALYKKWQSHPGFKKLFSERSSLNKTEFFTLFAEAYSKFDEAKTIGKGNFVICRLNELINEMEFSEDEKAEVKETGAFLDSFFAMYLLQIILMTNDEFASELNHSYRRIGVGVGALEQFVHAPIGLDAHQYQYETVFAETQRTAIKIRGSISVGSYWSLSSVRFEAFKKIVFSPFISFEQFEKVASNIFRNFSAKSFQNEVTEQIISLCREFDASMIKDLGCLKDRLIEIILLRSVLNNLSVNGISLKLALEPLKPFELLIRQKMRGTRDPELNAVYLRIYGENGFFSKGN